MGNEWGPPGDADLTREYLGAGRRRARRQSSNPGMRSMAATTIQWREAAVGEYQELRIFRQISATQAGHRLRGGPGTRMTSLLARRYCRPFSAIGLNWRELDIAAEIAGEIFPTRRPTQWGRGGGRSRRSPPSRASLLRKHRLLPRPMPQPDRGVESGGVANRQRYGRVLIHMPSWTRCTSTQMPPSRIVVAFSPPRPSPLWL